MPYIHFAEEQRHRASEVDLVEFLYRQGEKLTRSGLEYRLTSDHSVIVRGNEVVQPRCGAGRRPGLFHPTIL